MGQAQSILFRKARLDGIFEFSSERLECYDTVVKGYGSLKETTMDQLFELCRVDSRFANLVEPELA